MRRFVTYLYEYDKGNRGKNCGFVRIDVREGEVQMEVHMRNCLRCGEKGTIYILVEDEKQIFGIEMGDVAVSNGRGERTLQFDENNMEESGYEFDEIIGIAIRCENGGYLASNWKDEDYEALTWGNFSIAHSSMIPPSSEEVRPMPIQLPLQEENENITEPMQPWDETENSVNSSGALFRQDTEMIYSQEELESSISSSTPVNSEMKKSERNMSPYNERENENTANLSSKDIIKSTTAQNAGSHLESMSKQKEKDVKPQIPWWRAQMASLLQADIIANSQTQDLSRQRSKTVPQTDCFVQTPAENLSPKICSYQKITVADIRNLPSPNWYLCNNNFLLHGFFNYDYLIIKKEKADNREKFYLGVPGVFEKQEKAMAMMFGFPYFESCSPEELDRQQEFEQIEKEKEPKEGDFGCWYLVLNI